MSGTAARRGKAAGPAFVYLAASVVFTWPVAWQPDGGVPAPYGPADPYLNLWAIGWTLGTLATDPTALLDGRVFDANIFHPADLTLAYSDHLILPSVVAAPVYALTGSLAATYNGILVLSLAASGLAMHLLARSLTGSVAGAYAAGLAWAFSSYRLAHLGHLQLQGLYFLPLAVLFAHRLIARQRWRDALGLGLAAALQAIVSVYYGVIGAVGLLVVIVALMGATGGRRGGVVAMRLAGAALVGAVTIAPFVWPYVQLQRQEGFARLPVEASRHAATPLAYLSVAASNAVYGRAGWLRFEDDVERQLFPGLAVVGLALVGIGHAWKTGARPAAIAMCAVGVTGLALSFGPEGLGSIYTFLHQEVFGFQAIRAPARFAVLVSLALSVLAAFGMRALASAAPSRSSSLVVPSLAVGLLCVESASAPRPLTPVPRPTSAVGGWLAAAPEPGAVVYLPLDVDAGDAAIMIESLEHRRPIVNGYSGQRPRYFTAIAGALASFPSSEAVWTLRDLNVRFIVAGTRIDTAGWPLVTRAELAGAGPRDAPQYVYEVRWDEESAARLAAPAGPDPPVPGPIPFGVGERAVYSVDWSGGGGRLSAGTVVLDVSAVEGRVADTSGTMAITGRYRFTATAETAAWIEPLFEARDEFVTVATADLFPLVHERHLREGRRVVDTRVEFDLDDSAIRIVDAQGTGGGLGFRVARESRDALTTFYFVRTLLDRLDAPLRLPLVDAGRQYILELGPRRAERIDWRGTTVDAWRIEPVLTPRLVRRAPPEIRLWLSRDGRAIPLVVEVSAGFGAVVMTLDSYRSGGS